MLCAVFVADGFNKSGAALGTADVDLLTAISDAVMPADSHFKCRHACKPPGAASAMSQLLATIA
jgi:hypothetical protein